MSEQTVTQDEATALAAQSPQPQEGDGKKKGRRERKEKALKQGTTTPQVVEIRVRKPYNAGAEARLAYTVCALIAAAGVAFLWWLAHH